MEELRQYLPFILPIAVLQFTLAVSALVSLYKRNRVRFDNKWIWVAIILLGGVLGPIIYFAARGDEE